MNTAVAFIIFKRPDTTRDVFKQIKNAKPPRLYIIADGSRSYVPGEELAVAQTRDIVREINWNCEVTRIYSDSNLGCSRRVISGLNAAFENEDKLVILEDDTLPNQAFFHYSDSLLDRYESDERVGSVIGTNLLWGRSGRHFSYYAGHHFIPWGWATWKTRWQKLDFSNTALKQWGNDLEQKKYLNDTEKNYWRNLFTSSLEKSESELSWDYMWTFTLQLQNWLTIQPTRNLVKNIGMANNATHCDVDLPFLRLPNPEPNSPLYSPEKLNFNPEWDFLNFLAHCHHQELRRLPRLKAKLRIFLGRCKARIFRKS